MLEEHIDSKFTLKDDSITSNMSSKFSKKNKYYDIKKKHYLHYKNNKSIDYDNYQI